MTPNKSKIHAVSAPQPVEDNSVAMSIKTGGPASSTASSQSTMLIQPQPLKIELENSTDWPTVVATLAVGVGSIMTSLIVGWLSVVNQRTQVQSNIANFRHAWIQELRQFASRFISIAAKIKYQIQHDAKYLESERSNQIFSDLMETNAHIILMLDPKKDFAAELSNMMSDIINGLREADHGKIDQRVHDFALKSNEVLELGWQDIKRDLRNKRSWRSKSKET